MAAAQYDTVTTDIENGRYEFRANGSRMTFDGWRKVYKSHSSETDVVVPKISVGEVLELVKLITEQKFTQPPARYTEASLVKEMEDKNIGRPSTYASIITVLVARRYIKRVKKSLQPTKLGFDVIGILQDYFSDIVDVQFTGEMEDKLDEIELGDTEWQSVIADFYKGFSEELAIADKEVERIEKEVVLSDEVCELCGKPMAIKEGRFGNFLACTGYPECKNTRPIIKTTGIKCPKCGKDIVEKRGRKSGKVFYGCSGRSRTKFGRIIIIYGRYCCYYVFLGGRIISKPLGLRVYSVCLVAFENLLPLVRIRKKIPAGGFYGCIYNRACLIQAGLIAVLSCLKP